jgi:hypothetical protein
VGTVRHRQLVNVLSTAIALQMAVALVALSARAGRNIDREAQARPATGAAATRTAGGVLAGGNFARRRGAERTSLTTAPTTPPTTATVGRTSAPLAESTVTTVSPATTTTTGNPTRTPSAAVPAGVPESSGSLADPVGDAFVHGAPASVIEGRADIVQAGADYETDRITFSVQVKRPSDPRQDERWAADGTSAVWAIDTNGDAVPDYRARYSFVDDDNLGGDVSRAGDGSRIVCTVAATYSARGYKLTLDPACLGSPSSFTYRVTIHYATDPSGVNPAVASDVAPDHGLFSPVAR